MGDDLALGEDVGVLGVEVEEVLVVRRGVAVAARVGDHDRPEAVLERVQRRGPDAAARREAGDDDGVDALAR